MDKIAKLPLLSGILPSPAVVFWCTRYAPVKFGARLPSVGAFDEPFWSKSVISVVSLIVNTLVFNKTKAAFPLVFPTYRSPSVSVKLTILTLSAFVRFTLSVRLKIWYGCELRVTLLLVPFIPIQPPYRPAGMLLLIEMLTDIVVLLVSFALPPVAVVVSRVVVL